MVATKNANNGIGYISFILHNFIISRLPYVFEERAHDPAWWWAQASNLWGPGGPVVRFHLAHEKTCGTHIMSFPSLAIERGACPAAVVFWTDLI